MGFPPEFEKVFPSAWADINEVNAVLLFPYAKRIIPTLCCSWRNLEEKTEKFMVKNQKIYLLSALYVRIYTAWYGEVWHELNLFTKLEISPIFHKTEHLLQFQLTNMIPEALPFTIMDFRWRKFFLCLSDVRIQQQHNTITTVS